MRLEADIVRSANALPSVAPPVHDVNAHYFCHALPGGAASRATQERGVFDPARATGPEVPARRSVRRSRPGVGGRATASRSARRSIGTSASLGGWRKTSPCSTARSRIDNSGVNRLITVTGANLSVAAGIVAAIGDPSRFNSPPKLVSYFRLSPLCRLAKWRGRPRGRSGDLQIGSPHVPHDDRR
ncbi:MULTISPECIES: transposase [unclassified Bradyrhizobium]